MITILFDIDGTLIRSGGAGMKAIEQAFHETLGPVDLPEVPLHGRTDAAIFREFFEKLGESFDDHRDVFFQRYWELLPSALAAGSGIVLPGVRELLHDMAGNNQFALGILTGNAEIAARAKLEHFGLGEFFEFGGYGDDHAERNQVATLALASAKTALGKAFQPNRVWVIGDTIRDIKCARWINAKVVAVATGGDSWEALNSYQPDLLKKSFAAENAPDIRLSQEILAYSGN